MGLVHSLIQGNIIFAWIAMAVSFAILAKCADLFVESAVQLADRFKVPKLLIGIILVSLATTAPELAVSLIAAMNDMPEMAMGNAIGSVICDDGLGLALAGLFASGPILVHRRLLSTTGVFLVFIEVLAFLFVAFDNTLNRLEGGVLVLFFVGYSTFLFLSNKKGHFDENLSVEIDKEIRDLEKGHQHRLPVLILMFVIGIAGIVLSSDFIVSSATAIARWIKVPESVIALTLVAFGTSIPEFATCIIASRKGEGAIAVGNILGADILNICWVAGISSIANDLTLSSKEIYFMFPSMFVIVGVMLLLLRSKYRLAKAEGITLFAIYVLYLVLSFTLFPSY